MTEQELIEAAAHVRENAYAPYSQFKVGAALLTTSGDMFVGCNVENSSYGLTVCAERNAIAAMIAAGQTKFEKIVVAASPLASPCGACRQAIVEFGADTEVIRRVIFIGWPDSWKLTSTIDGSQGFSRVNSAR